MADCKWVNIAKGQKNELDKGFQLPVMEMFYSVQGEGYHTGKSAYFVRIGGCDVGCHWCDVKEAWDASVHPLTPVEEIVKCIRQHPAKAVVITGGEPLMYNLEPLCSLLKKNNVSIFLETSGSYPLSGMFDWVCVSPKAQMAPRKDMLQLADELKVIIYSEDDFVWAEKSSQGVKAKCLLYMQPEWSRYKDVLPGIVEYVMENPRWMISLQSHKFMNIP